MKFQNEPIAVWILAKLFDVDQPIDETILLKNLCQASFDVMTDKEGTQFYKTLRRLMDSGYIMRAIPSTNTYQITAKGVLEFRNDIQIPFSKIVKNEDLLKKRTDPQFNFIKKNINKYANLVTLAVKSCIDNAPAVLSLLAASDTNV